MQIKVILSRDENIQKYGADEVTLDFEEYVKGVVPSEIGNALLEACKAQAVAARTFALYRALHKGSITDKSSTDQAFRASRISSAYPNAMLAVEQTAGEVLYYNNKLVETCVYSASNGGRIKSSQECWGGVRGYLVAKDDPYDTGSGNGHGVGMSQNGAKNMASKGFSYKDILQFYYPGTEIRTNYGEGESVTVSNATIVREYALSKVGCGYVWGATGQTASEAVLQTLYARHPDHVNLTIVRKWIGKQIFDCAGFVAKSMNQVGIKPATGATSAWNGTQWARKGDISTLPSDKVCCLYKKKADGSGMQHTGLYLGDGIVVDARGSSQGVIKSTLSSYPWTNWGIPVGLYTEDELNDISGGSAPVEVIKVAYQAVVEASSGSTVNMRSGPSTNNGVVQAIKIGQIVDVTEVQGDWSAITWNGKSGYMMSKYLKKVQGSEGDQVWYVRLECDSEAQAKAIASILAKAKVTT